MKLLKKKRIVLPGLVILIGYFLMYNHPFPLNDGSLSKQEAAQVALEYLGIEAASAKTFVTYDADESLIAYLRKEELMNDYIERFDPAYPLDYYRVDIRTEDDERYEALVHQYEGIVAAWSREVPQTGSEQPARDETFARQIADAYLGEQRPGDLLGAEVSTQVQDGAYLFHYKQPDELIGEAYRMSTVVVYGDQVISYRSSFQLPEDFLSWLEQQDKRSVQLTKYAKWAIEILAMTALALAIVYRRIIDSADGAVFLWILIIIDTLHHFNLLPNYVSMLDLYSKGSLLLILEIAFSLANNVFFALMVYLPYIAGKALLIRAGQRSLLPEPDTAHWNSSMKAAVKYAYLFACIILAVQTLIFNIGDAIFHIWWIPEPMLETDNMLWPLLMPITAWSAAISEEIIYRLFAVTLLAKLLRSRFVAIVLSSMLWGLGHTAYPIYPVYTRFIEVTIIGIILGFIFIKYGFATAVLTHAAIDSILMGLDIMPIGTTGAVAAVCYMALPALVGLVLARWRRTPSPHILE
mgnify:CR=1 FL=1